MEILPSKSRFKELSSKYTRIPICGIESGFDIDPSKLYQTYYKKCKESFIFESGKGPENTARYSFWGRSNDHTIKVTQNLAWFYQNGTIKNSDYDSSHCMRKLDFEEGAACVDYLPHFWGGWVGFFGYDMIRRFEFLPNVPYNDLKSPDLYFIQVEELFVFDHKTATLKFILAPAIKANEKQHFDNCALTIKTTWKHLHEIISKNKMTGEKETQDEYTIKASKLRSNLTQKEYQSIVISAKSYIEAGDIYQANLAQRFECNFEGDPFHLYLKLKNLNPAPFSGFLNLKDFSVVSSSPERLVKLENGILETRPIAGTRPRGTNPKEDHILSNELLINEKERAEHLMLLDLERNDLGRICETGSVRVTDLMDLESYSHVTHIVSNIKGNLRPGISLEDILKSVFPGGTITGCPKIRCMEIIDELEPNNRGLYSGSFGYIGFAPYMDLNIIIRTILIQNGKCYFHAGAGIVADSDPEKEYGETLNKAAALIKALTI